MIKKIAVILFIGLLYQNNNAFSDDEILKSLKEGKKLVFIRHAIAPGNGDPNNFDINDCNTQRNLDKNGIEQSKKIGHFFQNTEIKGDKVLSSEWCRCKDTAKYAFRNFERLIYYVNNLDSSKTAEIMKKVKQNSYQIEKRDLDIIQKDFLSESCLSLIHI